jgi:hypothetical protein
VAACLDYGVAYTDDRIAQGASIADLATDPRFDGSCPVLLMGDLNAAVGSPVDAVRLAGEPVGGVFPSDHKAVVADLRWRG